MVGTYFLYVVWANQEFVLSELISHNTISSNPWIRFIRVYDNENEVRVYIETTESARNILYIDWVKETRVCWENHRTAVSQWQN
jgi:hypothetical protein